MNGFEVMRLYDEKLKAHPHYKRFIKHTPFENDCAAIAWDVVKELQEKADSPLQAWQRSHPQGNVER